MKLKNILKMLVIKLNNLAFRFANKYRIGNTMFRHSQFWKDSSLNR